MTIKKKGHIIENMREIIYQDYRLFSNINITDFEARLLILIIAEINHYDKEFKQYSIDLDTIIADLPHNEVDLGILIKNILSKPLQIESNNNNLIMTNLFSEVILTNNQFKARISHVCKDYYLELKKSFTSRELESIMKLKSKYAIKLYILLVKHSHTLLYVEDIQKLFQVPKSLLIYADFKRKILKVAIKQINTNSDVVVDFKEIKQGKKVVSIAFDLKTKNTTNVTRDDLFEDIKKELVTTTQHKILSTQDQHLQNKEIKQVISFFDLKRKEVQQNYKRKELNNTDAEYLLRNYFLESGRNAKMFIDAIQWLFSSNPKAKFHREYIMNIGSLIKHFNALEYQAMYSKESIEFNEEAKAWASVYKKKGLSEIEILNNLQNAGYLK